MASSSNRLFTWLFLGFATVVALFGASSAVAERTRAAADNAIVGRLTETAPRARAIGTARDELSRVDSALVALLIAAPGEETSSKTHALMDARVALDSALDVVLSRPLSAEPRLTTRVHEDEVAIDALVGRATDRTREGDSTSMKALVVNDAEPAVQRLRDDLAAIVSSNVATTDALVMAMHSNRVASVRLTYSLDAIALVAAALVAYAIGAMLRRHVKLEAAHEHVLESRAVELEAFAGRVAHDVLSPLTTVGLALSSAHKALDAREDSLVARGERALGRVTELVDALLAFARSAAAPEPDRSCRVRKVVVEILEEARLRAPDFVIDASPLPDCAVQCAPGVLSSILLNVMDNALKYTAGRDVREVRLRVREAAEVVTIEVEDSGPGVTPGEEEQIFLPGVRCAKTSHMPGIGLGLATVKRLVEGHGGHVGAKSRAGRGLLVWLTLPRAVPMPMMETTRNVVRQS